MNPEQILESKEALQLKVIKLAMKQGMKVLWHGDSDARGYVQQGVNGLYIIAHCQSQGSISMPLLWSDGKTFTRPISEFQIRSKTIFDELYRQEFLTTPLGQEIENEHY